MIDVKADPSELADWLRHPTTQKMMAAMREVRDIADGQFCAMFELAGEHNDRRAAIARGGSIWIQRILDWYDRILKEAEEAEDVAE